MTTIFTIHIIIGYFITCAFIIAGAVVSLFLYTAIEVFVQRFRFRKHLQPEDECTVLLHTYNKGGWFESATVEEIDYTTAKATVLTHGGQHHTVTITSVFPPFDEERHQTTEKGC